MAGKHYKFVIVFYLLVSKPAISQSVSPLNVFPLDSTLMVTEALKSYASGYSFILIGEQHGTREPLKFAVNLAKSLSKTKKVCFGFEIPADEIQVKRLDNKSLRASPFFKNVKDGRNSAACLNAIVELATLKNVSVFFFDATKSQENSLRDSTMYLNVQQHYLKDTGCVIITVSGNIHNQLQPYKEMKTMGSFLNKRFGGRALSVNHLYAYGTFYNNTGDGFRLKTITEDKPNVLKTISPTADYFYKDSAHEFSTGWNAFLFTTKINASFPVKNE